MSKKSNIKTPKINLDINDPPIRSEAREVMATPKQARTGIRFERAEAVWRPDLQCFVHGVAYCFQHRTGRLLLPKGNCTDMPGAIGLFERIDPHVNRIDTFSGDVPDTIYMRDDDEEWQAYRPALAEEEND